ncbi:MAG: gliding motility-associated C-terminal domain-containing protein [Bacteroidetes bacterium]|nr:gliding motility-associated C-terminal domain-containing protein [Bacteroidota bacterium]
MRSFIPTTLLALALSPALHAQTVTMSVEEYQERKADGTLPPQFHVTYSTLPVAGVSVNTAKPQGRPKGGGGQVNGDCNCWIQPTGEYTLAMGPNDDNSTNQIPLPFQFNLYGDLYSSCWINNNGNITFTGSVGSYSAGGFPAGTDTVMVAPFWGDVDTRNGLGTVKYLITPTALYVNWDNVGYYSVHGDLRNSFQLIITDGTDPVIGVGKNVSFCYKDMQWTTGDASGGHNGFGGYPATVGANRGNDVDFIQFGRFDHAGSSYDGPFGQPDGISWLSGQNFTFTTAVSTQNIPPIVSSSFLCDTVHVCNGELVDFNVTFLTPEADQVITAGSGSAPTLPGYQETITDNGTTYVINSQFIPTVDDVGFHTITYTATDNGNPALTTTVDIVIEVTYTPVPPPIITGDTIACEGQGVVLTAQDGFETYLWNNMYNGPVILVGPGTYQVYATAGFCRLASNTITVTGAPTPHPVIDGVLFNCGGNPAVLSTTEPYAAYNWSNGSHDPTVSVGTGTYSVSVTNNEGCNGTSPSVNVNSANSPDAMFSSDPTGEVFPGTTVVYTNTTNPNGTTIVSWVWTFDTLGTAMGQTASWTYDMPGIYAVTLTVTTTDGCTDTFVYHQVVIPTDIFQPNVFSPNGDGYNDVLEFSGAEFYPNTSLKVFNRWGQEVFSSSNYKNTWKGTDMPEGTYFYILKLQSGKDYTGQVTLLR